jgi:hypothetical protein
MPRQLSHYDTTVVSKKAGMSLEAAQKADDDTVPKAVARALETTTANPKEAAQALDGFLTKNRSVVFLAPPPVTLPSMEESDTDSTLLIAPAPGHCFHTRYTQPKRQHRSQTEVAQHRRGKEIFCVDIVPSYSIQDRLRCTIGTNGQQTSTSTHKTQTTAELPPP